MTTSSLATENGRVIRIRKGLNVPIAGAPKQDVIENKTATSVALVASDYVGMRPTLEVNEGDRVKRGQLVFTDKKTIGVKYTAPASGIVTGINRGDKRRFLSLTIDVEGDEHADFPSHGNTDLSRLGREAAQAGLVDSGLWTTLRQRPFGTVPSPDSTPHSIFVTAIDTRPLAMDPRPLIKQRGDEFVFGLNILRQLTEGPIHLCCDENTNLPGSDLEQVRVHHFSGPHPAGLAGTHIHFVDPVSARKTVWHIDYQDVIAIGEFFVTGRLPATRTISMAGPTVRNPRLLRVPVGASLDQLFEGELDESVVSRRISGSVLDGRMGVGPTGYLGRSHNQISALEEGTHREFLGWQTPGFDKFSIRRIFASSLNQGRTFRMTTTTGGSERAMVPIGMYEDVMPLDILPTFLLRLLYVGDNEQVQQLGALELIEEDLALCTFVDPGKVEWGPILRKRLTEIERDG